MRTHPAQAALPAGQKQPPGGRANGSPINHPDRRTPPRKNTLVLMGPQGHLEIAQAKSNTNLDTQDAFEVPLHQPDNTSTPHPRASHSGTPREKPATHYNGRFSH